MSLYDSTFFSTPTDATTTNLVSDLPTLPTPQMAEMLDSLTLPSVPHLPSVAHLRTKSAASQLIRIAVAQINPTVGDVSFNLALHQHCLAQLQATPLDSLVDILVFPELSLLGYPVRDAILKHPYSVNAQLDALAALAHASDAVETAVLVGFAEPRYPALETPFGKPYYNSVALLAHGGIQAIARKSLLPNGNEYDDKRVFEAAPQAGWQPVPPWLAQRLPAPKRRLSFSGTGLWQLKQAQIFASICEDVWNEPNPYLPTPPSHAATPWYALLPEATLHLNLSASVCRAGKPWLKQQYLRHVVEQTNTPLLYVNQVGATDEWIFEGASTAYGQGQAPLSVGAWFKQSFEVVTFDAHTQQFSTDEFSTAASCSAVEASTSSRFLAPPPEVYHPDDESDLPRCYEALCLGIRDYFRKTGFKRAVLGLSGGLDSAVNSVLLADALGGENVLACSFPSRVTPPDNRHDAHQLASALGMPWVELPIIEPSEAFLSQRNNAHATLAGAWGQPSAWSFAPDNVQAMSRATLLRLLGNDYAALPIATSDKSEFYLGYTTVNGDMSGALAPIGDLTKTKVRRLARWLNRYGNTPHAIPEAIITRPSGADLAIDPATGKLLTAEDALMPYVVSDEIIWRLEVLGQSKQHILEASWYYEQHIQPLSFEQKQAWVTLFFERMQRSIFKWWIAPPILICDSHSGLTHQQYQHPIASRFSV
jgi:NAD+ synthetase